MRRLTRSIIMAAAMVGMATAAHAWEPKGAVQLIVPFSPGGGSDVNARVLVDAIRSNDLTDANIIVKNMTGGSGAVAATYVASRPGDGMTLMSYVSGQVMIAAATNADVTLEDFTPIGTLALDTLLLVVTKESGIESFADLLEAAEAAPNSVTIGGTGRGAEDNMVFEMLNEMGDSPLQYVPFDGGGQVLAALLGGHITAGIFNPSEMESQVRSGNVTPIGAFAAERLGGAYADTPTFTELGYPDAKLVTFRGYVGPADMDPEALAYWDGVLAKVAETPEWKDYISKNSLVASYMNAEESATFWREEKARYIKLLTAIGIIE
ncbi:tripartite tricarboxylate transporter substrate binding protein [Pikeienuella sp. HZG-20]|uniref:Bug family tripartite tricarboxylate transporter substrate binding protein n=1 Tax=Paludibacillus litoralis TaxID=3133267 RepID=UPI0030ECD5EC